MKDYFRPLPQTGPARPVGARSLAGGRVWFERIEVLSRHRPARVIAAGEAPAQICARLSAPRPPLAGLALERPRIMGILNLTPDSFSDGGRFNAPEAALARAGEMLAQGAEILDIGGESTRPGAEPVPEAEERARVVPVLEAIRAAGIAAPISLDTRKAGVARAGLARTMGTVAMINDVSALTFDPAMARAVADSGAALCLMHARGDPRTMQEDPEYDDVVLDVFDYLEERLEAAEAAGIPRARLIVDPGIGFGKSLAHNLALLARLSLFHALGVPVLLGASRKRFIGAIGRASAPGERLPGSLAVALAAARQGVQILRVHDIAETAQALALNQAAETGKWEPRAEP